MQLFTESGKNATYFFPFTVDQFLMVISNYIHQKTLQDLLVSASISLLADESTDKAGHAQIAFFVRGRNID